MDNHRLNQLVTREKRSYLFAAGCSAVAALMMFYKMLLNDLYVKILNYPWMAFVLGCLIIGNLIHGFFAFKSFKLLNEKYTLEELIKIKIIFYKSLIINFLVPYLMLIILFISIHEYAVAVIALLLFILMSVICYFFDLRPVLAMRTSNSNSN